MAKKIILITGANTGIGYAIAQALLTKPKEPLTAILTSRSLDRGKEAVEALKKLDDTKGAFGQGGCDVVPMQLDLVDDASIQTLRKEVEEKFGRVDVLVNNAGVNLDSEYLQGKRSIRDAFMTAYDTNVVSTHVLTHELMPLLLKSSSPRLVFISSAISSLGAYGREGWGCDLPPPAGWPKNEQFNITTYRTSKTAMNMMIMEWRRVLKNDGVTINVVNPGLNATGLGGTGAEVLRKMGAQEPIVAGRFIRTVIEGERDADEGKMLTEGDVIPW